MFKILLFSQVLLVILSTAICNGALTSITSADSFRSSSSLSPEIVHELRDFLELIPTATVDEIVAKHYIVDGNFRKALNYLRSTQFTQLLQQVQEIPEIVEILDFLHMRAQTMAGKSEEGEEKLTETKHIHATCELPKLVRDEAASENQLDIVLLDGGESVVVSSLPPFFTYDLHTFSTFVEELTEHLPRDKYVQMIISKRQKSPAFAEFYAALHSVQLQPMVEATLKTKNLTPVVRTLSGYNVDVVSLLPIGFKVISWGPAV